ncbi:uncharacterized protein SPAPADRAFT_71288 [Spathaspora passalidarum NRRL Y-27907]|uniref:VPS9 domain-containing protein n=1 Tax=Spathaspora passalidarum (strain NRRL Y-27907 / 11-Y1) TaxID=619300 RepID=G3AMJ7_SPAPN|nr:uncharacterized protein SPAPADRAFT_71288 [Spathaspora passalidarum NRRL Y-27907]EGW33440.1 hypothetical protein SPAPADRAFT_71288 [Spathaspora passalidarum NRRL Y-27907]
MVHPFARSIIQELNLSHIEYTLLVPSAYVLNEYYDTDNNPLKELCYSNEEFLKSHIIKSSVPLSSTITPISKETSVIYNTINGKQVLIKNRMIYTGKGFRRSLKLRITGISYFNSFCDYLPKGAKFMLIYIESSLIGGVPRSKPIPRQLTPVPTPPTSGSSSSSQGTIRRSKSPNIDSITFETLLRNFPLLSKAVSNKFYRLFHHNNKQYRILRTNERKKLSEIKSEFHKITEEAYTIISDSIHIDNPDSETTYNLINHIISIFPGIDLNRLVYEYVELNLYDVLWGQLIFQFNQQNDDYDKDAVKVLTPERFEKLSCLSLNQLDLPIDKPWEMNDLYKRISLAIEQFKKLSDSVTSTNKIKIIFETVKILTEGSILINADTLIGLLIMVIIHSKVDNLEAHLYYIKNFNPSDRDGHFNYIMSNLDAVLYHLQSDESSGLFEHSSKNYELWHAIYTKDVEQVGKIVDSIEYSDELPEQHFLKSKNINGESCLTFAIRSNSIEIFDILINTNPAWLTIDSLLFDINVLTNQNLLMYALIEECDPEIMDIMVSIILENCTLEEQLSYFNYQDNLGRSVGHYLFHNYKLIDTIGHLIDWELKDNSYRSPLFNLCRCYDHAEYVNLVTTAFNCVYEKYGRNKLNFDNHVDKSGNTLLHVILKGIAETKLLSSDFELLDINQINLKNLTPLMVYVKYNRLENLQQLLSDERLRFLYEDSKNHYNVFDYLSFSAIKSSTSESFKKIEACIFQYYLQTCFPNDNKYNLLGMNGKYDSNNKDWLVFLKNNDGYSNYKSITSIRKLLFLTKLKSPLSTFPDQDLFWSNFNLNVPTTTMFNKFRINRLIDNLNVLFTSLVYQDNIDRKYFYKSFLTVESKQDSILEQKQKIIDSIERKKNSISEVKFSRNKIEEIEYFLQFSTNDLVNYRRIMDKLIKLISIGDVKIADVTKVTDNALNLFVSDTINCEEHSSWTNLFDRILWIYTVCQELMKNIDRILLEIKAWKDLYHAICVINSELRKLEQSHTVAVNNESTETNGTTSRRNSASTLELTDTIPENIQQEEESFFTVTFGETKKARYRKLLLSKSDKVKQIMKVNIEIKYSYEIIAFEISNFMKFKTEFLRFSIGQFVIGEAIRLKHFNVELAKVLTRLNNLILEGSRR